MIYKKRALSTELQGMNALKKRLKLSKKDNRYLLNLEKGFEGEQYFDSMTEKITSDCLVLNDLLFNVNNVTFQVDSLIIMGDGILLYEVKNYEGEYLYQDKQLRFVASKQEIMNPLAQLSRSKILIRQLIKELGFNLPLHAYVAFVNQNFSLFQAPYEKTILLPNMLVNHFEKINTNVTSITSKQQKLAKKLCEANLSGLSYSNLPTYTHDELMKDIYCEKCDHPIEVESQRTCICKACGYKEITVKTVLRHIEEFRVLFPNEKITTSTIQIWCGSKFLKKRIRFVLKKYFKKNGRGRATYYT